MKTFVFHHRHELIVVAADSKETALKTIRANRNYWEWEMINYVTHNPDHVNFFTIYLDELKTK